MSMLYQLENSYPLLFAILSLTNVEWAKPKYLKSSYPLINETD